MLKAIKYNTLHCFTKDDQGKYQLNLTLIEIGWCSTTLDYPLKSSFE